MKEIEETLKQKEKEKKKESFWVVDTKKLERYKNPEDSIREESKEKTEDLAKTSKFHLERLNRPDNFILGETDDRFLIIKGKDFDSAFKKIDG